MARALRADGMRKCIGCFSCMTVCAAVNRHNFSISKSAIKIKTSGGLKHGFYATVCHACKDDRACLEACPTGALVERKGGGVLLNKDMCTGCRKCVDACIVGAVFFDEEENLPIICKHCGSCTRFCPHQCLTMEEVDDVL